VFIGALFLLCWGLAGRRHQLQNLLLLGASYLFYGMWDWRYLSLLAAATVADYFIGFRIHAAAGEKGRKNWLLLSLVLNLGVLAVFKYFNFFVDNFLSLFNLGEQAANLTLRLALPVGISFFTFLRMTYTLDIYWGKLEPTRDFLSFANFSAFFPLILSGPIERASNMLPQFISPRQFSYALALDGLRQILWGLFKKVVVADNLGLYTKGIFANYQSLSGAELLLGGFYFAMQLYCDFSGYSDMAIGSGKLLGFRILPNFDYPYFSKNITELWRRWHVSLSTWFRDYLFTPLMIVFRNQGNAGVVASLIISFTLIGLWHGPSWTYVVFGLLHGLILSFETLTKKKRKSMRKRMSPVLYDNASLVLTFSAWCFTLVFFQSRTLTDAIAYIGRIFTGPLLPANFWYFNLYALLSILLVMVADWFHQKQEHPLALKPLPRVLRWSVYLILGLFIFNFIHYKQEYIYFQF
jgi:D-alanyl-lipoteichoic acid acyltransferase DltB (MBOAT superfamily)